MDNKNSAWSTMMPSDNFSSMHYGDNDPEEEKAMVIHSSRRKKHKN